MALRADDPAAAPPPAHLEEVFLTVLGSPNLATKRWAFEQYDSLVQGQTGPGADAAIVRIEGTLRAAAISSDGNGRYGRLDPYLGAATGVPPSLDLEAEARLHRLLAASSRADLLSSAHDCSCGGLAVALAEASIDGGVGFELTAAPSTLAPHLWLFSETASRVVVSAAAGRERALEELAAAHGVPIERIGVTGGEALRFTGMFELSVADAVAVHEGTIPRLMSAKRVAV